MYDYPYDAEHPTFIPMYTPTTLQAPKRTYDETSNIHHWTQGELAPPRTFTFYMRDMATTSCMDLAYTQVRPRRPWRIQGPRPSMEEEKEEEAGSKRYYRPGLAVLPLIITSGTTALHPLHSCKVRQTSEIERLRAVLSPIIVVLPLARLKRYYHPKDRYYRPVCAQCIGPSPCTPSPSLTPSWLITIYTHLLASY